ncbi:MAG: hypothetical protein PHY09_04190 [Desulfuromonadaceae bacterium]|nr:hypothetical protein [Desulfuromonadaceae bacterium]MDD5105756.1 hypothetical protein [Desulfuromonadaceae bacterium]
MEKRIITTVAVAGLLAALAAGDVCAAGSGFGNKGQSAGSTSVARPAGSQRRDGTFLTTGTTANGSTTRNGKGTGLQDGTCLTTPVVTTTATTTAQ